MLINKIKTHITSIETNAKAAINTVISDDVSQFKFFNNVSSLCSSNQQ